MSRKDHYTSMDEAVPLQRDQHLDHEWLTEFFEMCVRTFQTRFPDSTIEFDAFNMTYEVSQDERATVRGRSSDIFRGSLEDGTELAVKVIRLYAIPSHQTRLTRSLDLIEPFFRELTAWIGLDHINVARFLGFTLAESGVGLVSVWCFDGDLVQYLKRKPGASKPDLLLDVAEGLQYLHTCFQPLAHGDLKGTNILIDENGIACITDFGNSRRINDEAWERYFRVAGGGGALAWMAPEMLEGGGKSSFATDIYAFAGVMVEVLCPGKWPYHYMGRDAKIAQAKVHGELPDRAHYPETSDKDVLWSLMVSCWNQQPEKRPVIQEVVELLYSEFKVIPRARHTGNRPSVDGGDEQTSYPEDESEESVTSEDHRLDGIAKITQLFQKCVSLHQKSYPDSPIDFGRLNLTGTVTQEKSRLGFGRFADVFNGRLGNGTEIAIKVLRLPPYSEYQDEDYEFAILRFFRELNSWNGLLHVNITEMLGYTIANDDISLVSPLYPNGCLVDYLAWSTQASKSDLVLDVAEGLRYLHTALCPLIHSDLKGANILVNKQGIASLTDFGISKRITDLFRTTGFTTIGGAQGTTPWMSPELLNDGVFSLAADIYACAGVFLQIWCPGKWPYHYIDNEYNIVLKKVNGEPVDRLQYHELDDREDLWGLMSRCWSIDPDERPNIHEVVRALYDIFGLKPRVDQNEPNRPRLLEDMSLTLAAEGVSQPHDIVITSHRESIDREATSRGDFMRSGVKIVELFKACALLHQPLGKPVAIDLTAHISHTQNRLGYGCFSDVWKGRLGQSTEIAIKVLRLPTYTRNGGDAHYKSAFLRLFGELACWNERVHANVVPFLGFSLGHEDIGLVSPLCPNGNVVQFVKLHPEANKLNLMLGMAEGLRYLHTTTPPLVHSDIKGSNVLVDENGTACLADFGVFKHINDLDLTMGLATSGGSTSKTPWMAPELFAGKLVFTLASDIYACAGVFLEIFCPGKSPYHYISPEARMISAKRNGNLPDPLQYPELSDNDDLWNLLVRCWSTDPETRPTSHELLYNLFGIQHKC